MIPINNLFDINIHSKHGLESRRDKKNLLKTAESMGNKGRQIFGMVSAPNVPIKQAKKERTMRLAVATLHGASTLTRRGSSKLSPKKS